jgi:hypothetical protein
LKVFKTALKPETKIERRLMTMLVFRARATDMEEGDCAG